MNGRRRVVVTGVGAVTPVGVTAETFWAALLSGRSGVGPIERFERAGLATTIGGEVSGFDPHVAMTPATSRRLDHFARYALVAAVEAARQADLKPDGELAERTGVLVGTGFAANHLTSATAVAMAQGGARAVSPYYSVDGSSDRAAGEIALRLGATGPSASMDAACATGTVCVGEAMRLIRYGVADVMVAGGADDTLLPMDVAALSKIRALTRRNDDPRGASRPFDRGRDGFVPAAGAGVLVLEEAGHALRRGVPILAEVCGYAATTDAHHQTSPRPDGVHAARAVRLALDDARVDRSEVRYVNAHGTSTTLNDRVETHVIKSVFGRHATRLAISSIKSMTGHMIAGSGGAEAVATAFTVARGVVPPTLNCDDPEDADLDFVPHVAREQDVDVAVSNSFGFNGHNAALVIRRWRNSGDVA